MDEDNIRVFPECEHNLKSLIKDFEKGNEVILFLGAGVDYAKGKKLQWADLLNELLDKVVPSISNDHHLSTELKNQLFSLFCSNKGDNLSNDLYRYVQSEFPNIILAYLIKNVLGSRYIYIIQDYMYGQCNRKILEKSFDKFHSIQRKSNNSKLESGVESVENDFYCLFHIARLILLCPNIKAVVTYNYNNFLRESIDIIQNNPNYFLTANECEILNDRLNKMPDKKLNVVDVYGDRHNKTLSVDTLPIYHPHGYIPSPDDVHQSIDETSIVLSLDEFCDNIRNVYSWQTDTQMHFLNHYTCIFLGSSISDITIQRMLYNAQQSGNRDKIYCLQAYNKKESYDDIYKEIHKIKNEIHKSYGLTMISYDSSYEAMYKDISQQLLKPQK